MQDNLRYTRIAIGLHWLMAVLIIAQLTTGLAIGFNWIDRASGFPLMPVHKSLGLTIFTLAVLRLVWRLVHKPPPYPRDLTKFEKAAARLSHWAFYFFMLAVPLTGWTISSMGDRPLQWFGIFNWPKLPVENLSSAAGDNADRMHIYMAYALLALLILHIVAALKHHFIDRNTVLVRMLPIIKQPM